MSDVSPLSPRAKELTDRVTKRFLEQLSNGIDNSVSYDQISGASGLLARTGPKTFSGRTITGVANQTSVTNGNGLSGNPTIGISSTYQGQTSISTLGTITTGDVSDANIIAGVTSRHLDDKLVETISVKDFGAVGDGATDDTAAIQAAFNHISSINAAGSIIHFPASTYLVSSAINIPTTIATGLTIQGAGMGNTVISRKGSYTSGDIFYADTLGNPLSGWLTIQDLRIVSFNLTTSGASIHLHNRECVKIRNCFIYGDYIGIWCEGNTGNISIDNVVYTQGGTTNPSLAGLYFSGGFQAANIVSNSGFFSGSIASTNCLSHGMYITTADGLQVINCGFSGKSGITFEAGHGYNVDDIYVSNCIIDGCRNHAISFAGIARTDGCVYTNIRVATTHIAVRNDIIGIDTIGVIIDGDCDYINITNCNVNLSGREGIYLNLPAVNYNNVPTQSIQILNNEISVTDINNTNNAAVHLVSGASGVSILGNFIGNRISGDISEYAIALDGSNSNILIASNNIIAQDTAGISFGQTVNNTNYPNLLIYGNNGVHDRINTVDSGTWNATKISEVYGGTNQSSYTLGDTLYSSASNTLAKLAGNTTTSLKILTQTGDGANSAAPVWNTATTAIGNAAADGTTKGVATFTAADFNASSGVISLDYVNAQAATTSVNGFLSSTDWTTFNGKQAGNSNLTTITTSTQGDILYSSASNTLSKLSKDTNATRYLSNQGTSNNPSWNQINLANGVTGLLPSANLANTAVASLSGTNTGDQTTVSGNAGSATVLQTARTINGVNFNGSANIVVPPFVAAPKVRAYLGTNQSLTSGVAAKVVFDTETYDTNSNYDSSTNYRFTPTVAGTYLVITNVSFDTVATVETFGLYIFKNGSEYSNSLRGIVPGVGASVSVGVQDTVVMNGSTDYLEIYAVQTAALSKNINAGSNLSWVSYSLLP